MEKTFENFKALVESWKGEWEDNYNNYRYNSLEFLERIIAKCFGEKQYYDYSLEDFDVKAMFFQLLENVEFTQEQKDQALAYVMQHPKVDQNYSSFEIASKLIEIGANPNAIISRGEYKGTILGMCADRNYWEIKESIEFLLQHGADQLIPDKFGRYPIMNAMRNTSIFLREVTSEPELQYVEMLVKNNPEATKLTDKTGRTALWDARISRDPDDFIEQTQYKNAMKRLKEMGFDLNHQDNNGQTILSYFAATFNPYDDRDLDIYSNMINIYIEAGVDPKIKDKAGKTAMDYVNETFQKKQDEIEKQKSRVEKLFSSIKRDGK